METNTKNTEKNEITKFAFLPEMVIEHLNHSKPADFKTNSGDAKNNETSNTTLSQSIIFDPLADPFDGINIEIKPSKKKAKKAKMKRIKFTETITVPKLETSINSTSENKIIQFAKKMKFNFFNF